MANILELFTQKVILDYTRNRQYPTFVGDALMPSTKIESLEFDILANGSKIPTVASIHAFDTEAEIGSREGSASAQELGFIKRKMQLKEKDLIGLRNPRTPAEQAYLEKNVYNDIDSLVNGVLARVEVMRMDVIANGKINIDENGLQTTVDYHVPAEHQKTLSGAALWTDPTSSPIDDMQSWANEMDERPTRSLTSGTIAAALLKHPEIRELFKTAGVLPTMGNLNEILTSFGLPKIVTYDSKYRKQLADGAYKKMRFFPEHKFVMFGSETLGQTIYGPTPEESRLLAGGSKDTKVGNVFATMYESGLDPVATWTKACATAMPSFSEVDHVFQASVIAPEV